MGLLPLLALLVANLLWSTSYAASKFLLMEISPQAVAFWRYALAGLLLLPWLLPELRRISRRAWRDLILMGVVGLAAGTVLQVAGIQFSLAANAALLISLETVFCVLLAALFLGEGWSPAKGASLLIAFLGVAILNVPSLSIGGWWGPYAFGNLLLVVSTLLFALHILWSKALANEVSVAGLMGFPMLLAAVALVPFLGADAWPRSGLGWSLVAYQVLISTLLAYGLWMWGLKRVDAGLASLTLYLQPLGGALVGALFLKEPLPPGFVWGAACIGIALLIIQPASPKKTAPEP